MLRGCSDEEIQLRHQALQHLTRSGRGGRADSTQKPLFTVFLLAEVFCFHQSVGEDDEPIAGCERYCRRFILRFGLNADGQSADVETFNRSVAAAQDGSVVTGIDVMEDPPGRVVLREKSCGEAQSTLAV